MPELSVVFMYISAGAFLLLILLILGLVNSGAILIDKNKFEEEKRKVLARLQQELGLKDRALLFVGRHFLLYLYYRIDLVLLFLVIVGLGSWFMSSILG